MIIAATMSTLTPMPAIYYYYNGNWLSGSTIKDKTHMDENVA